jgi:transposase
MAIVGGFDVHRAQITFDYLDTETGEASRGQVRPAGREVLRSWLAERFGEREDVVFAVEGCTGWRFVAEELARAGIAAHLAEPADTATQRGRKKRAKTDRADARLLRELLAGGRLPESWVAPEHVLEVRTLGRLYVALMDERRSWQQRAHAQLFHQGVPPVRGLLSKEGRAKLADAELSVAGRQVVDTALEAIDHLTGPVLPLRA